MSQQRNLQNPTVMNIRNDASQSIGASIDGWWAVSSSDYGAAVGQPIIRGMSGTRVKILNNGVVIRDVSGLGPDHAIDADLNNIQQIEIVQRAIVLALFQWNHRRNSECG